LQITFETLEVMAELKTKETDGSVDSFLESIENDKKRRDCIQIAALMQEVSGAVPKMWGEHIVGFGNYHYTYASGREGDWFLIGFSPRKQNITIYTMCGLEKSNTYLEKLGTYKTGKSCLYIKTLEDIDQKVLKELLIDSIEQLK
jgi:hypothetical protein